MSRDFEHFPAAHFGSSSWEITPELGWRNGELMQKKRRYVWDEGAHFMDRPTGHFEYEWFPVPKIP